MNSQQREKQGVQSVNPAYRLATDYVNTIAADRQRPYPGRLEIEQRISNIIRWNAMSMVVRANKEESGIGGHIASYASSATLLEVGFNHFFRGRSDQHDGDLVYLQGHASPGIYARAFLEGRLSGFDLSNFRRELAGEGGLPSYPHPKLMPDFWQFPTVSMGLTSLQAIYEAHFIRYLENRELKSPSDQKVWAFMGDGEMDEPESLGAITMGSREKLDNLIFVINCNLQRLDGPVRGNGKIVQELESLFIGAGWNVIKLLWGSEWDPLFEKDTDGLLVQRLNEIVDGQFQKYSVSSGDFIRQDLFGTDPKLLKLVENYSDEQLENLRRGGHDPYKIYAAFKAAVEYTGAPTLILAQTVKGFGMGSAGEGLNITHQQKKMNEEQLLAFRTRFGIPIPDYEVQEAPFYKPAKESDEITYLQKCRSNLGGYVPSRAVDATPLAPPEADLFDEFYQGSGKHAASSTMSMVRLLSKLIKDPNIGRLIVPIVPDEARTFGMEPLFRQAGIYSSIGQLYEPVDREFLLYYDERKDGAILEEGISEAGSMSSFIAAGNAYATHGINTIPFYLFYSMFGVQRMVDLIWAAGDMMVKGFLLGGISGKTTLAGEGLQHQDGHGHHTFLSVPNMKAYDPAFAFEQAVIIREGLRRMYEQRKDEFYYISMMNEAYHMPPMPAGCEQGILKGLYKFKDSEKQSGSTKVNLMGSGAILLEALKAQQILESEFGIAADVWSVTSYKELYTDALEVQRQNMLRPDQPPRQSYLSECFADTQGVFVAASDYMKALPCMLSQWIPGRLVALGTDGFGRSDTRGALRHYFEVNAEFIVLASLHALMQDGKIESKVVAEVIGKMEIDPEKINPMFI